MPEPTPKRIAAILGLVFALQVIAMLILLAGGIVVMITLARNNSLECTTSLNPDGSCVHHSYALGIGLLVGGFGLFLVGMVTSATYAMRHIGAPVLGALNAKRRLWEQQSESNVTSPPLEQ